MANNILSPNEVKRYFLLANAGKRLFRSCERASIQSLEEECKRIVDKIFGLDIQELDRRITDKARLVRYNGFDWYRSQIALADIGPWPKMHSLDARLTTGNVLETAKAIEGVKSGNIVLPYDNEKEKKKRTCAFRRFLDKTKLIIDNLGFVYEKFPIILFPGGEVREKDYNTWARENHAPLCRVFEHDLDDGNNRAVSYALAGINEVPCFVGITKTTI